ncbi:MAG: hypothetical protein WDN28_10220 [Chthoniobacter sp.]
MVINDMMFSAGTTLTCLFKLALQLIHADTEAQWMLAIEQGLITAETDAPPTETYDANLLSVDWQTATPLVLQRLILGRRWRRTASVARSRTAAAQSSRPTASFINGC